MLSIEVPKFGEDLPLVLDLTGPVGTEVTKVSRAVIGLVDQGLGRALRIAGETSANWSTPLGHCALRQGTAAGASIGGTSP